MHRSSARTASKIQTPAPPPAPPLGCKPGGVFLVYVEAKGCKIGEGCGGPSELPRQG
jgi:hypothetical protein